MRFTTFLALLALPALAGCVQPGLLFSTGPDLATSLVKDEPYPELVVEIDHAPGREPCPGTVQALKTNLQFTTAKERVRVARPTEIPLQGGDHDNDELVLIHKRTTDHGPTGRDHGSGVSAHLHVVFLDGNAASDNGGHAAGRTIYDYGVVFIFRDAFDHVYRNDDGRRVSAVCDVERTVMLHELGHALGIVDRGVPQTEDREHPAHPGHSMNPNSVMYPRISFASDGRLLQELPVSFDATDLADLAAFRNRA